MRQAEFELLCARVNPGRYFARNILADLLTRSVYLSVKSSDIQGRIAEVKYQSRAKERSWNENSEYKQQAGCMSEFNSSSTMQGDAARMIEEFFTGIT